MPCSVSEDEIDFFANQQADEHLKRLDLERGGQFEHNSKLCAYCSTLTRDELVKQEIYDWYMQHLIWETNEGHQPRSHLISEILRLEK